MLEVSVIEVPFALGHWLVEAIDHGSEGEVYRATFDGCKAEVRARAYAETLHTREHSMAGNASHTPGPWNLVSERRSQGNLKRGYPNSDTSVQFLICGPAGATVITRRGLAKPSKPEGIANARLIAAAPDLLEALSQVLACIRNVDDDSQISEALWDTVPQARAAIAKATGS